MCTVAEACWFSICVAIAIAVLIGTAKPWVVPSSSNELALEPAVSMPMTWPAPLTSGPPESPGWMSALVWIRPVSCSEVPEPRRSR